MPATAELPRPAWRRRALRLVAILWVGAGLAAPLLALAIAPSSLLDGTAQLTLVLLGFAVAGSNVELRFSIDGSGPVWSPVGIPIVLAVVACSLPQAMLVASLGYLLDRATWRRGRLLALETAGLGATTAGIAALAAHAVGLRFDSPGATLVAALAAALLFLGLDAITYGIWYQLESRSGGQVLRYFVHAAPVDVTFTAVAAVVAGPFVGSALVVALVLVCCQLGIFALYRMATSEARHRQQSDHLRDVFSRYVPESVAERLADGAHDIHLGGELREVSVLFCDIRGFTSWSEHRPAELVVRELNELLGVLAQVVLETHGTLDKFTGDGLMAFWGAPLDQPDHAERACRAAIEMQHLLDRRARELDAGSGATFRIGIGVASGTAVVGNVGHDQRLDYTAIGDVVNLAARLEQATKGSGHDTLLAHDTWAQLPPEVRAAWPALTTLQVRGRTQEVLVHARIDRSEVWHSRSEELASLPYA